MAQRKISSTKVTILVLVLVFGALFGGRYLWQQVPQTAKKAITFGKLDVVLPPDIQGASLGSSATFHELPSKEVANNGGTKIKINMMAWSAQAAVCYANGGLLTTKGSLIDSAKLQVELVLQNDCFKTVDDVVKFANEYKSNPSATAVAAIFMGDGMPGFEAMFKEKMGPLFQEFEPVVFTAVGKSYGEDQFMGPPSWKENPQLAIGGTIACVIRDGDQNLPIHWTSDNKIPINPDEKTYDPKALNFISASDYVDATTKYITGYKEPRKLIVDGKKTNKDTLVTVMSIATWTPQDVRAAQEKGGLTTIVSTFDYSTQMPAVIMLPKKYLLDHRTDVENLIAALGKAGDQVRSFSKARSFAFQVAARVFAEDGHDAAYWEHYYVGVRDTIDRVGVHVSLGGSMVFNLTDVKNFFGLGDDKVDRYKAVYNMVGGTMVSMYPEVMPSLTPYETVVDKRFMSSVIMANSELTQGSAIPVQYGTKISQTVSNRSYPIQFETGSSVISPTSEQEMQTILASSIVSENLRIGISGHTDNVGNDQANQALSEQRANAVRGYLISNGIASNRIDRPIGYGASRPVASNSTALGKAKNRRVDISFGRSN